MIRPAHLAAMLVLVAGCALEGEPSFGSDGGPSIDAGGSRGDASPPPLIDAGTAEDTGPMTSTPDAAPPAAAVGVPADPDRDGLFGEAATDASEVGDLASCFDGIDNGGSDGSDCDDLGCRGLASCCVGSGDCCGPVAASPLPTTLDFGACGARTLDVCASELGLPVTPFGSPAPFLDDGALAPGGDLDHDSGLAVGQPVDLTSERVTVGATFLDADGCEDACLESLALGFVAGQDLGDATTVRASVALLFSASRDAVSLVVGDEIAGSWPAASGSTWQLVLRPTGTLSVLSEGAAVASDLPYLPEPDARLLVWGRSRNPGGGEVVGARIATLTASVLLCDIPDAWGAREPVSFSDDGGADAPLEAGAPSLASSPAGDFLAFAREGELFVARLEASALAAGSLGNPSLVPGHPHEEGGLDDPELLWNGSAWELWYTAIDRGGVRSVGHATLADADPTAGSFVADDAAALDPGDLGVAHADQPTALAHPTGRTLVVARLVAADGAARLVPFVTELGGGSLVSVPGEGLSRAVTAGAVGADEIAHPSLVVHDHAYQLHYARRRGTRWSIGLALSDELVHFRLVPGDVLGASGQGFDRLGATAPDARATSEGVELTYLGHDGVRARVGLTSRRATGDGVFR